MRIRIDRDRIQHMAEVNGDDPEAYTVLSAYSDPFYVGSPAQVAAAQWFAEQWARFGFHDGTHLRRIHYRLVSQDPKLEYPSAKANQPMPYENTAACWKWLLLAGLAARYLGLVNAADFDDRRTPGMEPHWPNHQGDPDNYVSYGRSLTGDELVGLPDFPDTPYYVLDPYPSEQRYAVEVWCEKSGQGDILGALCTEYGANYVPGMGEMSVTTVTQAVKRAERYGKPLRILYISDFDPAGADMPISVARKLEFLLQEHSLDARLEPIILTKEQVEQYRLPGTPLKPGDNRRTSAFQDEDGNFVGVELDALAALRRDEFERIVREAIERYYDPTIAERAREAHDAYQANLDRHEQVVVAQYRDRVERLRTRYEDLRSAQAQAHEYLKTVLQPIADEMDSLWTEIGRELEDTMPANDTPVPEATEDDTAPDELFDSSRDYLEQLVVYKARQRPRKTARQSGIEFRARRRAAGTKRTRTPAQREHKNQYARERRARQRAEREAARA